VLAGVGAAFYEPDDATLKDVTRFSAQIGGGANFHLSNNVFLQLDARWLPTFFNDKTTIFCSGGCTIAVNADSFSQFQLNAGLLLRF
jgi:opacity protein-like surface antigen